MVEGTSTSKMKGTEVQTLGAVIIANTHAQLCKVMGGAMVSPGLVELLYILTGAVFRFVDKIILSSQA